MSAQEHGMPEMAWSRGARRASWALVGAYLLLALIYSVVNPMLESPDELTHYGYIEHLVATGALPVQVPGQETAYEQEGSQPPLYYVMGALLVRGVDTGEGTAALYRNPNAQIGIGLAQDNRNLLVHDASEGWPWHGIALAVHLLRLYSIALGALSAWGMLSLGRTLLPRQPTLAMAGAALAALNPMFLYLSSSINNDNLVICLGTWGLVLAIQLLGRRPSLQRALVLGLLAGCAALAKVSGALLLPLALLTLWIAHARQARESERPGVLATLRAWLPQAAAMAAVAALVAGWWYLRNLSLYGELTGTQTMLAIFGRREGYSSFLEALQELQGFLMSYWGLFGYFNIVIRPLWIYYALECVLLAGAAGAVRWGTSRGMRERWAALHGDARLWWESVLLMLLWIAALGASLLHWTMLTHASQARLIFPALAAVCFLATWGLCAWLPERRWRAALTALVALESALALAVPWAVLRPAYAVPAPLAALPAQAIPFGTVYGDALELVAYELADSSLAPGEATMVTLYWRVLTPVPQDYSVYIHLFGRDGQEIGQRDSLAGMGLYPTSRWQVGELQCDRYELTVSADAIAPVAARLNVGLYDGATMVNLPAADGEGREVLQPTLGFIKIEGCGQSAPPAYPLDYTLGAGVRLVGYDLDTSVVRPGETVLLALHWETAPMDGDYTVFVHVVAPDGTLIGQGDGPPLNGEYPTGFWGTGESLLDAHTVSISPDAPAGPATLHVGLYAADGQRLPVSLSGTPAGDSAVLGEIEILP